MGHWFVFTFSVQYYDYFFYLKNCRGRISGLYIHALRRSKTTSGVGDNTHGNDIKSRLTGSLWFYVLRYHAWQSYLIYTHIDTRCLVLNIFTCYDLAQWHSTSMEFTGVIVEFIIFVNTGNTKIIKTYLARDYCLIDINK